MHMKLLKPHSGFLNIEASIQDVIKRPTRGITASASHTGVTRAAPYAAQQKRKEAVQTKSWDSAQTKPKGPCTEVGETVQTKF